MAKLIHKFLEDEERGRTIVAAIGLVGGLLIAVAAVLTTHFTR